MRGSGGQRLKCEWAQVNEPVLSHEPHLLRRLLWFGGCTQEQVDCPVWQALCTAVPALYGQHLGWTSYMIHAAALQLLVPVIRGPCSAQDWALQWYISADGPFPILGRRVWVIRREVSTDSDDAGPHPPSKPATTQQLADARRESSSDRHKDSKLRRSIHRSCNVFFCGF